MNKIWNIMLIIILSIFVLIFTTFQSKATTNTLFNDKKHQVSLHPGVSLRDKLENLYVFEIQYSQGNTFFGLDGRQNIEVLTAQGIGAFSKYNQHIILGISEDVVLYANDKFYTGASLGAYIKSATTDRISSKFTFGQKIFVGLHISQKNAIEIFIRHFSNGTLTESNSGQNFIGMGYTINF